MPKALVLDALPPRTLGALQDLGLDVQVATKLDPKQTKEAARDATVLIVRSTKVPRELIEAAPGLALVVRAGAGVNTIDVGAASEHGVYVANTPGKNAIAVAELALGLMISLDRRIPDNVRDFRDGKWNKGEYSKARGLYGRTLGIAGFGQIGVALAERAAALGMRVVAWSRSLTPEIAHKHRIEFAATLQALAARSDVFSIHLPLTDETRGIVNEAVLAALPEGALIINTARAEVVDEQAILQAATADRVRVATDVFTGEPAGSSGAVTSPLASIPNIYVTHHIGASTEQAQDAIADETVRIVRAYLRGETIPNCVNLAKQTPARYQLVVRHNDKPGVLAGVLGAIKARAINVEQMQNEIFDGARAACARIALLDTLDATVLAEIRGFSDVLHAEVLTL